MKLKYILLSFILLSLSIILFSCIDDTENYNNDNNKEKEDEEKEDDEVFLISITIAGKKISPGKPGANLNSAETVSLTLNFDESTGITPIFETLLDNTVILYGKMKEGDSPPPLSGSSILNFNNNDIFVIRVFLGNIVQFYKIKITVIPPPPTPPLEQFQKDYMNFADKVYVTRITTAGSVEITGKTDAHYVDSTITIENVISDWQVRIRGRGNSTWGMPKKPYRIRGNSRNDLFERNNVRNWALIANYSDKSLMRNYITHLLGRSLGTLEYTANVIFTEVYFNGRYDGLYCLQDHQESGPSRVNVEGFTTDAHGNITDVGFMIELDSLDRNPGAVSLESNQPNIEYFTVDNRHWFIKYPQFDDNGFDGNPAFHRQAVTWIKNYVTNAHNAIQSRNMVIFDTLCDRASFIDFFLINELTKDVDGAAFSVFVNKKPGGKLCMGPVWDFDLAYGNADYIDFLPQGWWILAAGQHLPWFRSLMTNNGFYEDFRTRYLEISSTNIRYTIESIDSIREIIRPAALRNFNRWQILNSNYLWPNPRPVLQIHTWDGQVDYVKNFLSQRNAWMYDQLQNRRPISGVR